MTQPLHHQLLSRANKLKKSGAASSIEHGLSLARTELEDERKRELQDAHCRALDEWARARSRESIREDAELSPKALASLETGLLSAKAGRVHYLGSFAQYAEDE